jgi:hypothetical protein
MNLIQEILNILERKEHKKTLELKKDWFEFGRTRKSSVGNPLYTPKMTPHAIRFDDLKCQIISGLVEGTGTEHTLPMWSTVNKDNCNVQTIVDSIFSQDPGATEGLVSGDFRVTGNTVLEGDLLVLGTQTIVESTIVEVADNIMRINSGGAGVDAGIEVIQPSGTKTWAWDVAQGLWSTFGDNIRTEDIFINGAIHQDGESLVNVVNEAEGLASQDNDNSLATVAAIIDWSDQMDLDVVADSGAPLDILLNSEALHIVGGSNINTDTDGQEKVIINLDDDIDVNSVTTNFLTLKGVPGPYQVTSIVNDIANVVDFDETLLTARAISQYVDDQRDYVQTVALNGTSLDFNGVGNGFGGSVDLSSIAGGGAALTGGDVITVSNGVINHDAVNRNIHNPSTITMGYGQNLPRKLVGSNITFDAFGHITNYWAEQLRMPDWLGLTNVSLNGTNLSFTSTAGSFGGFSGSVDLSSLGLSETLTTLTYVGDSVSGTDELTYTDENGNVHVISGLGLQVLDLQGSDLSIVGADGVTTNTVDLSSLSGGTSAPVMSASVTGTGKLFSDVVQPTPANPVTDTADRTYGVQFNAQQQLVVNVPWTVGAGADGNDFVSNVTFDSNTSVLDFTGTGGAFNGSINLAALASTETLTSLQFSGGNLIYIDENNNGTGIAALDIAPVQQVLGDGQALSSSYDTQTGITTISPILNNQPSQNSQALVNSGGIWAYIDALTFPNDIDYVSAVVLNGTDLEFTSVGNGFNGSVSLATLLDDTNTTYDLGSNQDAADVNIRLTGSDATSDNIKFVAGTNITLTDNGANEITIDAASGSSSFTFGTYLTETGGTVNHDATNRTDNISAASPSHGDSFTVIDTITTNATGHVEEVNTKTVTLPTSDIACISGIGIQSAQQLQSQWQVVGQATLGFPMGFSNNSGKTMQYALTWTLELTSLGTTGVKGFNVKVVADSQTTPIDLWQFDDSNYFVSELASSHTWTYAVANCAPGQTIEIQIQGDTSLTIQNGQLTVIESECSGTSNDRIQVLPIRN